MLRSRRLSPPVEMGDSSYYALTADARQLAAVVIAGAGAGVLTGLSTYEVALANVKQERKFPPVSTHAHARAHGDGRDRAVILEKAEEKIVQPPGFRLCPLNTLTQGPCSKADTQGSIGVTVSQEGCILNAASQGDTSCERFVEDGYRNGEVVDDECAVDAMRIEKEGMKVNEKDVEEEDDEAAKLQKLQRIREIELENEKECDCPLDDMSKDELKERILPFLAGDLFLIWRETDLATEKEKIRIRNKQLQIVENNEGVSEAVIEERRRLDAMTYDERTEHEKDKREEVVYTMLQEKYGLDEDKITDDAERLRKSSKG